MDRFPNFCIMQVWCVWCNRALNLNPTWCAIPTVTMSRDHIFPHQGILSCRICPFLRNLYISAESCRIRYWSVVKSDKCSVEVTRRMIDWKLFVFSIVDNCQSCPRFSLYTLRHRADRSTWISLPIRKRRCCILACIGEPFAKSCSPGRVYVALLLTLSDLFRNMGQS